MSARTKGFSLVELLIAMAIGIMLIGGTMTIFQGNLRSAELSRAIAAMQANARYALDEMAAGIRVAGSRGCAATNRTLTVSAQDVPLDDARPDASALVGMRVTAGDWTPAVLGDYAPPAGRGAAVVGTDALLVQYARSPGERVTAPMGSANGALGVAGTASGLLVGDLAVVTDCAEADLFRIQTRTGGAGGVTLKPDRNLSRAYDPSADADNPKSVRVLPFTSALYYVGDSGRRTRAGDTVRSLFLQRAPFDSASNPPLELVDGVDQMRLSFTVASGGELRRHRLDGAAFDPGAIGGVGVGLLMASDERFDTGGTTRIYTLADHVVHAEGATAAAAGVAFHPADRRLRLPFERSVSVRNRTLEERVP